MEVQRQQSPSSGSTWQVQSVRGVKQGQWEQTHTSEITGDQGQKITRHSYQAQHSSSSHQQSFYHSSQNSGAIQFRTHETEPNFPALMQKDGKWEVRRVSVDDNTRYAPQTSMEVQPLERKVTLGATDKNAPQRKELMKEFKQKAQTKTYEDVLEDGTHVKRIIQTSGGTTYDEPGSQTRVHSVREHVVMSKRY
ncbi:uncharacterized protein LOC110252630 [Exaiptasia diaphana]|uniref:Uncharacterized protein n=1 Tax=Exaiptasia diaphana TaxID=2652724 RepID=A0A913Y5J4_EXADI|nr:uncharacterized protein LOC110252630 [Exaiptasia diaphana]